MVLAAPARIPEAEKPAEDDSRVMEITLVDAAAAKIANLSKQTGLSPERLLEASLGLLSAAVDAGSLGRRVVVTTKGWWPLKELELPKVS